jgi:phosphoglycerate dehydrogenase-like enzyme
MSGHPAGGRVLVVLGPSEAGLFPLLQAALPGEDLVLLPAEGEPVPPVEVLAVLGGGRDDVERALSSGASWIHVLATGVDGFPLDLVGSGALTCSRGASAIAISEFVLALMLSAEKRLAEVFVHEPTPQSAIPLLGSLRGKTVGIVGMGAIGHEVARRALAFEMRVLAVRRTAAPARLECVALAADLASLLGESDHLVVAAPATPATRHLIGAEALAAIKPGAHLVNVSRGALVDQEALLAALDDGRVALASLDVTDPEPLPAGHTLYTHPKVRISPHISWSSLETMLRTIELFADNLTRWRASERLEGVVDIAQGY